MNGENEYRRKIKEYEHIWGGYDLDLDGIMSIVGKLDKAEDILETFLWACKAMEEEEEESRQNGRG